MQYGEFIAQNRSVQHYKSCLVVIGSGIQKICTCGADSVDLVQLEDGEEGFLRHFDIADLFHALLATFLFLQQFALTAHITAITLGKHILTHLLHRLTRDNLGADGSLDGNIELLAGNELLQFLAHPTPEGDSVVLMGQRGKGINRLTIEQDVELDEL